MPQPFRGVLAVIVGEGPETDAVVGRAAALAEEAHARLTVAALVDRDARAAWLGGLALTASCLGARPGDVETHAHRRLTRAAKLVPPTVGLTTLVSFEPPRRALDQLLAGGGYDLLVVEPGLLSRSALARLSIPALIVPSGEREPPRTSLGAHAAGHPAAGLRLPG